MFEWQAPILGLSKGFSVDKESPLTSGYMNNIRPIDTLEKRIRLGQRPGLDKWGDGDQIGGASSPIVAICIVSTIG